MRLFLVFAVISPIATIGAWKNLCAYNQKTDNWTYFTPPDAWNFNDIRYERVESSITSCAISVNKNCSFFIAHDNKKDMTCFLEVDEARCRCDGRLCNLDIGRFLKRVKAITLSFNHCKVPAGAPRLGESYQPTMRCLQTKDRIVTMDGKRWAYRDDITEFETDTLCGISFTKNCHVKFFPSNDVPKGEIVPNQCMEVNDEIRCECASGNYCNGDIEHWLNLAKKVSGGDFLTKCNYENVPYYAFPAAKPQPYVLSSNQTQFCGASEVPLFRSREFLPYYTTISPSSGLCQIEIDEYCTVSLKPSTEQETKCNKSETEKKYSCFCSGRLCNFNLQNFVSEIIKEHKARNDLWEYCGFERALVIHTMHMPNITCLSSEDGYVFKQEEGKWKDLGDLKNLSSDSTCGISFSIDCNVRLETPKPSSKAVNFETCLMNERKDKVYCECMQEDLCNSRISEWMAKAEVAGARDWDCVWDRKKIPVYYDLPPTTTTTKATRRPYVPRGGCLCDDVNGGKDETPIATTTPTSAVARTIPLALFQLAILFL